MKVVKKYSSFQGLNAILDHRAQVFIPELGCTFECPPTFRVFACQNPSSQGGGRKGLPKSFLNRFTKVCSTIRFVVMDAHDMSVDPKYQFIQIKMKISTAPPQMFSGLCGRASGR